MSSYTFVTELWRWSGESAWHFVTLPEPVSRDVRELMDGHTRGFGSVRVRVRVVLGPSAWTTSVFPDKASGCHVLPVKKTVRSAADVEVGDDVEVHVELLDPP